MNCCSCSTASTQGVIICILDKGTVLRVHRIVTLVSILQNFALIEGKQKFQIKQKTCKKTSGN